MIISFQSWGACPLNDGDIVFIKSKTEQAKLLHLTTGSEWTHVGMAFQRSVGWDIIEAVQPVRWTSLNSFVRRSNHLAFKVFRPIFNFDAKEIKYFSEEKLGQDYDLVFSWNQNRWYCSELVWKAYKKVAGEELGVLEKIGDLKNIDKPAIRQEAYRRFSAYGEEYNHDAWKKTLVITPVQMMKSKRIKDISNNYTMEEYSDCLR